jgi:hypothetical protein
MPSISSEAQGQAAKSPKRMAGIHANINQTEVGHCRARKKWIAGKQPSEDRNRTSLLVFTATLPKANQASSQPIRFKVGSASKGSDLSAMSFW